MRKYTLYLYGYGNESSPLQRLLPACLEHQISNIVDIRDSPYSSKRPAWNSNILQHFFQQQNITYQHIKSLGNIPRIVNNTSQRTLPWNKPDDAEEGLNLLRDHLFVQGQSILLMCCEGRSFEYGCSFAVPMENLLHRQLIPYVSRCHRIDIGHQIRIDDRQRQSNEDEFKIILLEPKGIFQLYDAKYLLYLKSL